jgi:hypothetical protein
MWKLWILVYSDKFKMIYEFCVSITEHHGIGQVPAHVQWQLQPTLKDAEEFLQHPGMSV